MKKILIVALLAIFCFQVKAQNIIIINNRPSCLIAQARLTAHEGFGGTYTSANSLQSTLFTIGAFGSAVSFPDININYTSGGRATWLLPAGPSYFAYLPGARWDYLDFKANGIPIGSPLLLNNTPGFPTVITWLTSGCPSGGSLHASYNVDPITGDLAVTFY